MQNIDDILRDLYALDPEFRNHEAQVRVVLKKLMELQPNVRIDESLAEALRKKLLAQADLMKHENLGVFSQRMGIIKRLSLMLGSLTAVAGLALIVLLYTRGGETELPSPSAILSSRVDVLHVGANAFGNLNAAAPVTGRDSSSLNVAQTDSPAFSQASATLEAKMAPAGFGLGGDAMIMPYPSIKYVYKGDTLNVNEDSLDVYKRVKGVTGGVDAGAVLRQMNLGAFDSGSFNNLRLQQVTMNEDREFGYSISVNLEEGAVYIGENWTKWNTPDRQCQTDACYQSYRLKPSDIPADEEVIALANKFLDDHGIHRDAYGAGVVADYWRQEYERAADKSQVYIPDTLSVVYPLRINDAEVYDESGNKAGLMVMVNIRVGRVSGVNELTSNQFEASAYKTEKNVSRILQLAEQGGFRGRYFWGSDPQAQTVEAELGTPEVGYVKIWQYDKGQSQELLVPALIFPITKQPSQPYYYQKNVVVPLIAEILDQPGGGGVMPLIMDSSAK